LLKHASFVFNLRNEQARWQFAREARVDTDVLIINLNSDLSGYLLKNMGWRVGMNPNCGVHFDTYFIKYYVTLVKQVA